jgi:hypothetical protein
MAEIHQKSLQTKGNSKDFEKNWAINCIDFVECFSPLQFS